MTDKPEPAQDSPEGLVLPQFTADEIDAASEKVCVGGAPAGGAFFGRHPALGYAIAVQLQCELTAPVSEEGR